MEENGPRGTVGLRPWFVNGNHRLMRHSAAIPRGCRTEFASKNWYGERAGWELQVSWRDFRVFREAWNAGKPPMTDCDPLVARVNEE